MREPLHETTPSTRPADHLHFGEDRERDLTRHVLAALGLSLLCGLGCITAPPTQDDPNAGRQRTTTGSLRSAEADEPIDFRAPDRALLARAIWSATNDARREHGLPAVAHHPLLDKASALHARNMVRGRFFSHTDPHNARLATPRDRALYVGVRNPYPSENLAITIGLRQYRSGEMVYSRGQGQFSRTPRGPLIPPHTYASFARSVVTQWMNSPGHRRNILDRKAVQLGCAAEFYWKDGFPAFMAVQNFQRYSPIKR